MSPFTMNSVTKSLQAAWNLERIYFIEVFLVLDQHLRISTTSTLAFPHIIQLAPRMFAKVVVLAIALIAQVSAFQMRASPLARRTSSVMKMSVESMPTEVLSNHGMLVSAGISGEPDALTTVLAFLFIAAAIMGSLQDFLKAFENKPQT